MATAAAELFVRVSADTKGLTSGFDGAAKAAQGLGDKVTTTAGHYVDANGRMRDANGKFVSSAGQAAGAANGLAGGLDTAGKKAGIFGDVFKGAFVGNLAADAAAKVIGFFTNQLTSAVSSLMEVEKANAQTVSVIKSTGGAAGVTAQHVMDYANSLERTTGVAAENIQRGQNLLLTFTNIRNGVGATNQIFDQATDIMVDLSAAMGGDAKGAAIQLGKALNDPTQGITALTRVGVSFTDGQKAQIKALQESGDIMGAQKIILAELRKEFGGSAEALGKTLPGAINRLDNGIQAMMKNFMSPATGILTNGIIMAADASFKLADIIEGKGGIGDSFRKAFGPTTQALIVGIGTTVTLAALPAITAMLPALAAVAVAFIPLAIAAAKFIAIAGVIAAAAYPIAKNWDTIREVMGRIVDRIIYYWDGFRNKVASIAAEGYQMLTTAFTKASAVIRSIIGDKLADQISKSFGTMQAGAISFGSKVSEKVSEASSFAKKHWGGAADDLKSIWSRLTTVTKADLSKLGKTVKDTGTEMAKTGEAGKKASEKAAKAAKDAQAAHEALAKATQKGYERFELMARALTTLSARLRAVDSEAAAQGRSFDIAGAKANAYKESLSAIESAFGKMSIQAENARAEMERFAQASANGGAATAQAYGVIDQATKALDNQAFAAQALGKEWDATAEGIKSAEGVLTDLIDKGLRPGNKAYDEAAEKLAKAKQASDAATTSFNAQVQAVQEVGSALGGMVSGVQKLADLLGLTIPRGAMNFAKSMTDGIQAVSGLAQAYQALEKAVRAKNLAEDSSVTLFILGAMIGAISYMNNLFDESRAAAIAAQEAQQKEALANEEIMRRNFENIESSTLAIRENQQATEQAAAAAKTLGDSITKSVAGAIKDATVAFIAGVDGWQEKMRSSIRQGIFNGIIDAITSNLMTEKFGKVIKDISEAFRTGNYVGASNMLEGLFKEAEETAKQLGNTSIKFLEAIGVGRGEAMQMAQQAMGTMKGNASAIATYQAAQQSHTAILTRLSNVAGGRESEEYKRSLDAANRLSEAIRMEKAGQVVPANFFGGVDNTLNKTRSLAVLPGLATGGLVTGPTMAHLGEGGRNEAVLPLNENVYRQIGQGIAAARGGGGGAVVNVNYTGNGKWTREDAQGLGRLLVSELRTMGVKA